MHCSLRETMLVEGSLNKLAAKGLIRQINGLTFTNTDSGMQDA